MSEELTIQQAFERAVEAYRLGDYEAAVREFEALESRGASQSATQWNIANCYLNMSRAPQAAEIFASYVGGPRRPEAHDSERVRSLEMFYIASRGWPDYDLMVDSDGSFRV